MGILASGASFLNDTLPITVLYTGSDGQGVELEGVWCYIDFDRHGRIGVGAERNTQEATFHVEQSRLSNPDQRATIKRDEDVYQIHNIEPIYDATYRLHLRRIEGAGASPIRPMGRR